MTMVVALPPAAYAAFIAALSQPAKVVDGLRAANATAQAHSARHNAESDS